jgi:hypothetical protein
MFGMCNSESTGAYANASHQNQPFLGDVAYCTSSVSDNHSASSGPPNYILNNSDLRATESNKFELQTGNSPSSQSPSAIVSDNGLQYANLDGSPYGSSYHHHHHSGYSQYSDLGHNEAGVPGIPSTFSAYLENQSSVQYAPASHYPALYHQPKLRTPHEYPSYPHVPKSTTSVPTYKWMQVKRNVPKPGKQYLKLLKFV